MQSELEDWGNSWFIYLGWFGGVNRQMVSKVCGWATKANSRLMVEQGQEQEGLWQDRYLAVSLQGPFL